MDFIDQKEFDSFLNNLTGADVGLDFPNPVLPQIVGQHNAPISTDALPEFPGLVPGLDRKIKQPEEPGGVPLNVPMVPRPGLPESEAPVPPTSLPSEGDPVIANTLLPDLTPSPVTEDIEIPPAEHPLYGELLELMSWFPEEHSQRLMPTKRKREGGTKETQQQKHNKAERKRRNDINDVIDSLKAFVPLPKTIEQASKLTKLGILYEAVDYIQRLHQLAFKLMYENKRLKGIRVPQPTSIDIGRAASTPPPNVRNSKRLRRPSTERNNSARAPPSKPPTSSTLQPPTSSTLPTTIPNLPPQLAHLQLPMLPPLTRAQPPMTAGTQTPSTTTRPVLFGGDLQLPMELPRPAH